MLSKEQAEKLRVEFGESLQQYLVQGEGPGEPAVLPDASVKAIEQRVDEYVGTDRLPPVVEATLIVSHVLETKEGSPLAARRLADVVGRPHVLEALQAAMDEIRNRAADDTAKTASHFSRFVDEDEDKVAPDVDAKKPDDAISVNDLDFPKRM